MKVIIYFMIALMLSGIILSAFPKSKSSSNHTIQLVTKELIPDKELMKQSASIIQERLSKLGLPSAEYQLYYDAKQISIQFTNSEITAAISPMIFQKGAFGIFELYKGTITKELVRDFSLQATTVMNQYRYFPSAENKEQILPLNAQIATSIPSCVVKRKTSLTENEQELWYFVKDSAFLSKSDILEIAIKEDKHQLAITLTDIGALKLNALSRTNLNLPLVVCVDDKVLLAPIVKTPIENGECIISGNFSVLELSYFACVLSTADLPVQLFLNE